MSCSEANRWSFEHRRHETIFINNLAYIAHHKHAYIVSTNREIEREQEEEGREDYKRIHQINFFSQKYHQRTETGTTTDEKEKKILRGRKHLLNTEQGQCKERNIRQLHSSHINRSRIFFSGIFFRQFLNHINGCMSGQMSDFQLNTERESTGQINIDHAWPGQFVWAVVYKPFRAQSIGIYKMMNGFVTAVMDEMQMVSSEHQFGEDWLVELHTRMKFGCGVVSAYRGWLGSNFSFLEYPWTTSRFFTHK